MLNKVSILLIVLINPWLCFCETDRTLEEWATDVDVVDLVIQKIKDSAIFPDDNGIMKRMAYVESRFGNHPKTFRQNYYGGIWQVNQDNFLEILTIFEFDKHPEITNLQESIKRKLRQLKDMKDIRYEDLLKPIYSGLLARIILHFSEDSIPEYFNIEEQAKYWQKNYRIDGSIEQFVQNTNGMEKEFGITCSGRMDLAIVLDGSTSIGSRNYELAKQFVAKLIATFSLDSVNIGFIVFSDNSEIIFPLKSKLTLQEMNRLILENQYPDGWTNTNKGIKDGVEILNLVEDREGVPKIMAIFTDGEPTCEQYEMGEALELARSFNISIFAIGIGSNIKQNKLLEMTNSSSRVFSMSSYEVLSKSFEMMNSQTCKIPQKPIVGKQVTDSLKKREKRYFYFRIPDTGITIKLNNHMGSTRGYYSYTHENPSSALNDGEFTDQAFIPLPQSKSGRFKREVSNETLNNVFIAVEGKDQFNNYTIATEEGYHVSASNSIWASSFKLFSPIIVCIILKTI